MGKYIDAEELKRKIEHEFDMQDAYLPVHFLEVMDDVPTADVQEVVKEWCYKRNCIIVAREDFPRIEVWHGRWQKDEQHTFICSVCGCEAYGDAFGEQKLSTYCPNCGSRMDLDGDTE